MTMASDRQRWRFAGASAALTLLVSACGTGGAGTSSSGGNGTITGGPGVDTSAKTINLGIISPLSGKVAVIGKPLTAGQEAYFKHVNDAGGVGGYKLTYVEKDDVYDPQKHVTLYNEIQPSIAMLAQSLGSPTTQAIQQQADGDKILFGTAAQASNFVSDKNAVVIGTPYAADAANGVDYIVNKLGKKDAKIGILYQNDAYGQDGLKGYKAALAANNITDVAEKTYTLTDKSVTAQVGDLKSAGAQYVFVVAVPSFAGLIVGTAAAESFFPQWVFQGPAWSEYLMTKDGTANGTKTPIFPALAHSTWVLGFQAAWGDTAVPGMAQFLADHDKYFPQQPPDGYFMYGYCMAEVEVAIIKKAIESGDLSRGGLLNAKLNLGTFDFGGLVPPLTYTTTPGAAARMTDIAQVDPASPAFLKIIQPYFESDVAKNLPLG